MSPEKIKQLMHYYTRIIGLEPRRDESGFGWRDANISMGHVVWMCGQVLEFVDTQRMAKANRWIGFIQGVLWSKGIMTIDQMRKHNMPDGETFAEETEP
jgi:hypothetical protein